MPADFQGSIRAFWDAIFSDLQAGHRVLDIGTGNGSLPALLWDLSSSSMPTVDAVDLAEIAPAWIKASPPPCRQAIAFHPGVAAESLPFAGGLFDLAVSQYGFEYSDHAASVDEVVRVLKPRGHVALIMHHAGSRLKEVAEEEDLHAGWLRQADGFLDRTRAIYRYMALAGSAEGRTRLANDPAAALARQSYNEAMQALGRQAGSSRFPDLLLEARDFVAGQLEATAQSSDATSAERHHDRYRDELADAALRYRELCDHALDEGGAARLADRFRLAGLAGISYAPLHHENGMLMGWTLTGHRPAGD